MRLSNVAATASSSDLLRAFLDEAEAATFVGLSPGPHALLTVRDTGCGMDAQVLEHLFEPYFTTKEPGEGTGMGLAVVHAIVEAHDGAITVDSEPGVGSTLRVYLPVRQLAASEAGDDEPGLSPEGARFAAEPVVNRVVLPRELSVHQPCGSGCEETSGRVST